MSILCAQHNIDTLSDTRQCVNVVLLDVSKAFDILNNRILLAKLEARALSPVLRKWVAVFLREHFLWVRVGDQLSP